MNKFDKPFRILPTYDEKKINELFVLVSNLNTYELQQYSLLNQIPFDVCEQEGENLIHTVININNKKASQHVKLNIIKFLVQKGVNPDKPNKYNQTPLHLACRLQLDTIIDYLIDLKVNVNYQDNMGLTPLHYLLAGDIKLVEIQQSILDFIQPTGDNFEKKTKLIEIKKELWTLIEPIIKINKSAPASAPLMVGGSLVLPFIDTLNNTMINLVNKNFNINNIKTEIINSLANQSSNKNIRDIINIKQNEIIMFIKDKFNKFSNLKELKIHTSNYDSWGLNNETGIIEHGNIKRSMKVDLEKLKNNIITLNNEFKSINKPSNYNNENGFNQIYSKLISKYLELEINPINPAFTKLSNNIIYDISKVNDIIRHKLAVNNSSDIIDFNNLQFTSGPMHIDSILKYNDPWDKILKLFKFNSNFKIIAYMLRIIINLDDIKIDDITIKNEIDNKIINYLDIGLNNIDQFKEYIDFVFETSNDNFYIRDFADAYYLIYEIIFNGPDVTYERNEFYNKWFNIYSTKPNIGAYVLDMMTEIYATFKDADSNLNCNLPFNVIIFSAALNNPNPTKNLLQNVINIYKPHLIKHIVDNNGLGIGIRKEISPILVSWIILLLSNPDEQLFNDLITNNDNIVTKIKELNISDNLKNLGLLVYYYFNNKSQFVKNLDDNPELKLFYSNYKKNDMNDCDSICNIIRSIYEKLELKPLLSTLLDTIYHINEIDFKENTYNIDDLKLISPSFVYMTLNNPGSILSNIKKLINNRNIQPSLFGLSYIVDFNNGDELYELNKYFLASSLGLSYNGKLYDVDKNLDNIYYYDFEMNSYVDSKIILRQLLHDNTMESYYNITSDDRNDINILVEQIPYPLNFINLNPNSESFKNWSGSIKYTYYNFTNLPLRIPTIHGYLMMLLDRINYYQNRMNKYLKEQDDNINQIVTKLINGDVVNLKKLYTELYPEITKLAILIEEQYTLLDNFNKEYKDNEYYKELIKFHNIGVYKYNYNNLADFFNKINIDYYLYYYLYKQDKLINLNRFNYYQISTTNRTPYVFYLSNISDTDSEYINFNNPEFNLKGGNIRDISKDKSGLIGLFRLGNYRAIYKQYENNNYNTDIKIINKSFNNAKFKELPHILENSLPDFYKIVIIEIIKEVIKNINSDKSSKIYKKLIDFVKLEQLNLKLEETELAAFVLSGKLTQELINTIIISKINEIIINKLKEINIINLDINLLQLNIDTININLTDTNINLDDLSIYNKNIKSIYSIVSKLPKEELFILYPNDLTNTSKYKVKYYINIQNDIIDKLLNAGANPYIHNLENESSVYQLIVNYNYKSIKKLKDLGLDFRVYEKDAPITFIKNEIINITDKILYNYNSNNSLASIFSNINNYLFRDVKNLITANESFGNNILNNLEESFHLSTYLILQFMSQFVLNLNNDYNIEELNKLCYLINITKENINSNYINNNISIESNPDDYYFYAIKDNQNIIIIEKLLKETTDKKDKLQKVLNTLNETLKSFLREDMKTTFKKINNYENIENEINTLNNMIVNYNNFLVGKKVSLVEKYNDNLDNIVKMEIWDTFLNKPINNNYNLIPLLMLIKQKENINDNDNLNVLRKGFKQFANIAMYYFETEKYTETNFVLNEINIMLNEICKLVIGNGLELIIRRILMQYFIEIFPTESVKNISERIDMLLNNNQLIGNNIIDTLYDKICPKLVKNATEIYKNRNEHVTFTQQTTREILLELFNLLDQFNLPGDVMVLFKSNVVSYFDTITSKCILLWYVNIENILKYFINNYRCIETYYHLIY